MCAIVVVVRVSPLLTRIRCAPRTREMEPPCTWEEDDPECYVCADRKPCDKLRASHCACKGRFIHDGCLKKLVRSQKVAICMVCKEPYANVEVRTRYERVWGTRYGVSVLLAVAMAFFLCVLLFCIALNTLRTLSDMLRMLTFVFSAASIAIILVACGMIGIAVGFGGGLRRVRREGMHRVVAEDPRIVERR